jgi:hypothetical protein
VVEPPAIGAKSDGNEDEDWMDEMITHGATPWWETSSPKRCSTQVVEERMIASRWSDALVLLLCYV